MPYPIYKMIHVVSIVLFFSCFAVAAYNSTSVKLLKILKGVCSLTILVSGFGLMARLGVMHGAFPLWITLKLCIWFIVVIGAPIIVKRAPQMAVKFFWFSFVLLTIASYLANYKVS